MNRKAFYYCTGQLVKASWALLFLSFTVSAAQQQNPSLIKAAFVFQMSKFINWQDQDSIEQFHFGIVGQDEYLLQIFDDLQNKGKLEIQQKPVKVEQINVDQLSRLSAMQLVFVTVSAKEQLAEIIRLVGKSNTLIVTEDHHLKCDFMINLVSSKGKWRFEFNLTNLDLAGLSMKTRLQSLGTSVCAGGVFRDSEYNKDKTQRQIPFKESEPDSEDNMDGSQRQIPAKASEPALLQRKTQQPLKLQDKKNEQIDTLTVALSTVQNELKELKADRHALKQTVDSMSVKNETLGATVSRLIYAVLFLVLSLALALVGLYVQQKKIPYE